MKYFRTVCRRRGSRGWKDARNALYRDCGQICPPSRHPAGFRIHHVLVQRILSSIPSFFSHPARIRVSSYTPARTYTLRRYVRWPPPLYRTYAHISKKTSQSYNPPIKAESSISFSVLLQCYPQLHIPYLLTFRTFGLRCLLPSRVIRIRHRRCAVSSTSPGISSVAWF